MNEPLPDADARRSAIQAERSTRVLAAVLRASAVCQLLFAAFAFGHSRGPVPPRPVELGVGIGLALLCSLAYVALTWKRRLELTATHRAVVHEGRRRRRIGLFADYLAIDQEIVLRDDLESAELAEGQLVVRYRDPKVGPVLRTFDGDRSALEGLKKGLGA